jgi:hypothetical protein
MVRRRIGQETLAFVSSDAGRRCSLDDLHDLIDWAPIDRRLASISCSAQDEPAWPPLAWRLCGWRSPWRASLRLRRESGSSV